MGVEEEHWEIVCERVIDDVPDLEFEIVTLGDLLGEVVEELEYVLLVELETEFELLLLKVSVEEVHRVVVGDFVGDKVPEIEVDWDTLGDLLVDMVVEPEYVLLVEPETEFVVLLLKVSVEEVHRVVVGDIVGDVDPEPVSELDTLGDVLGETDDDTEYVILDVLDLQLVELTVDESEDEAQKEEDREVVIDGVAEVVVECDTLGDVLGETDDDTEYVILDVLDLQVVELTVDESEEEAQEEEDREVVIDGVAEVVEECDTLGDALADKEVVIQYEEDPDFVEECVTLGVKLVE